MDPVYITESDAATKYELKGGRKRSVSKAEWKALREAQGQGRPLFIVQMTRAEINSIPGQ